LGQRDQYLGQRDQYLGQRDQYLGQRDQYLGQRDQYLGQVAAKAIDQDKTRLIAGLPQVVGFWC
jgi:uncharacterized protein (DUF3084 family)